MDARTGEGLVKDQMEAAQMEATHGGRSKRRPRSSVTDVGVLGWRVLFLADAEKFWRDEIHREIL